MCALAGFVLRAQAPLAVADAGKFMGARLLTLDSPQGPFAMTGAGTKKQSLVLGR